MGSFALAARDSECTSSSAGPELMHEACAKIRKPDDTGNVAMLPEPVDQQPPRSDRRILKIRTRQKMFKIIFCLLPP
jgi:hypothetical protein